LTSCYNFVMLEWPAEALCSQVVYLFVCFQTCDHDSLKQMHSFWCKLVQVVHWARTWSDQLRGSGGQSSRSHKAKDRVGCLVEASVSAPFSRVAFLGRIQQLTGRIGRTKMAVRAGGTLHSVSPAGNRSAIFCFTE